jgi:hypothetical protein
MKKPKKFGVRGIKDIALLLLTAGACATQISAVAPPASQEVKKDFFTTLYRPFQCGSGDDGCNIAIFVRNDGKTNEELVDAVSDRFAYHMQGRTELRKDGFVNGIKEWPHTICVRIDVDADGPPIDFPAGYFGTKIRTRDLPTGGGQWLTATMPAALVAKERKARFVVVLIRDNIEIYRSQEEQVQ